MFRIVLFLTMQISWIESARRPADWARMTDDEWNKIEEQWAETDAEEERKIEGQYEYERMMQKKKQGVPQGVSLSCFFNLEYIKLVWKMFSIFFRFFVLLGCMLLLLSSIQD